MKRWLPALFVLLLAVFVFWPSPVEPLAFRPAAPPPMHGVLAPNTELRRAELFAVGQVRGPEDVAVDSGGLVYAGTADGLIVRVDPAADRLEKIAETGGRPLGLHFDAGGRLVICDAERGLLRLDAGGEIETLADGAGGVPFRFTDDLDIASDGRIYFSDASSRFGHHTYMHDLLEARPHGRLLRHDPATGVTETLLEGLYFANGVALSEHEDFVLVNETYRYRITRLWLSGPKAGTSDIFADNLPGFADGISANRRGTFWAALFTVRNPRADSLHPHPRLKALLAKLPRFLWPKPAPYGLVVAYDEQGRVTRTLQDPGGERISQITSVQEEDGALYFGTLSQEWIGRLGL